MPERRIVIDRTHMGRRASGIERVTHDLFSAEALAPLPVEGTPELSVRWRMALHQMLVNPGTALVKSETVWVFPGYPPSPLFGALRSRAVLYVHDLFLMTRKADLNRSAKLFMAFPFRSALKTFRNFMVSSQATRRQLLPHIAPDARVVLYRPSVSNVFGLTPSGRQDVGPESAPLIVGAVGTMEPRKNFTAAARICVELCRVLGRPVELHIVGRKGWGGDFDILSRQPHVRLHGFLSDTAARAVIEKFDLYLCTSHDEGLGLPLLETQYAGVPVVAPDQAVFREVLGESGTFIDPKSPEQSATVIAELLRQPDWRPRAAAAALANVERWNAQAEDDRRNAIAFLGSMTGHVAGGAPALVRERA